MSFSVLVSFKGGRGFLVATAGDACRGGERGVGTTEGSVLASEVVLRQRGAFGGRERARFQGCRRGGLRGGFGGAERGGLSSLVERGVAAREAGI